MDAISKEVGIDEAKGGLLPDEKVARVKELTATYNFVGMITVLVIQSNIVFALAVKAVFLVLALLGHTSLWFAILADTGATLVVIANALRLLNGK